MRTREIIRAIKKIKKAMETGKGLTKCPFDCDKLYCVSGESRKYSTCPWRLYADRHPTLKIHCSSAPCSAWAVKQGFFIYSLRRSPDCFSEAAKARIEVANEMLSYYEKEKK